jgi:glutathione S-transferase
MKGERTLAIELYWASGSPFAWRVMLTLEVKKLAYESKLLQFSKGENKTPAYLQLNPRGKVPTLKDGDYVVNESLAIMSYLDRKYPDPPLFGKTPEETGLIWRALAECESYIVSTSNKVGRPIFFGQGLDKDEEIQQAAETLRQEFKTIDERLAGSPWLVGDKISAADYRHFPIGPTYLARCVQRRRPAVRSRFPSACATLSQHLPMGTAHRSVAELPAHLPATLETVELFNVVTRYRT